MKLLRLLTMLGSLTVSALLAQDPYSTNTSAEGAAPVFDVKARFQEVYEAAVRHAIDANTKNNAATNPGYWANSRDFCFSTKPSRPTDAKAAFLAHTKGIERAPMARGVNPTLPRFEPGTPKGEEQKKHLKEVLARLKAKDVVTYDDLNEMVEALLPFLRASEAAAMAEKLKITVPAMSAVTYDFSPHCLQVDAPAVGTMPNREHKAVGHNQSVAFYPASILIPKEAEALYSGILNYEVSHPESRPLVHTLLWGIRGADLKPPPINPTPAQIAILNAALPDGTRKYAEYVELAQHPERRPVAAAGATGAAASDGPELLTLDAAKNNLLQHHLDFVTIDHKGANPFDPANTEEILRRLTNPIPVAEFVQQPEDQCVANGSMATFAAQLADEVPAPRYQWQFNDKDIKDANTNSLTIKAGRDTVGTYRLVAFSGDVALKSNPAKLTLAGGGRTSKPTVKNPTLGGGDVNNCEDHHKGGQTKNQGGKGQRGDDIYGSDEPNDIYGDTPRPITRKPPATNTAPTVQKTSKPKPDSGPGEFTILDDGLIGRGKQDSLSRGRIQIINPTNKEQQYDPSRWILATREPCQPSSSYPVTAGGSASSTVSHESDEVLNEVKSDVESVLTKPCINDLLRKWLPVDNAYFSTVVSTFVRAVPFLGSAIAIYEASYGYDAFTGEKLSQIDQGIAILGAIPGASGLIKSTAWPVVSKVLGMASSETRIFRPAKMALEGMAISTKISESGLYTKLNKFANVVDLGEAVSEAVNKREIDPVAEWGWEKGLEGGYGEWANDKMTTAIEKYIKRHY